MKVSGVEAIHLAVQYLAAAGISLLDKKEDDSHSNLGFSDEKQYITTRPLNKAGDHLALSLQDFALLWVNSSSTLEYSLNKRHHHDVLSWIHSVLKPFGLSDRYSYKFHYSLPYQHSGNFVLDASEASLKKEIMVRTMAQRVLRQVLQRNSFDSEIRIWPHHFDTGAFSHIPTKDIAIGLGLAIPDQLVDDHYFYLSGYRGNKAMDTLSFKSLTKGKWTQGDFQGAVLATRNITEEEALQFFQHGIAAYTQ